MTYAIIQLSGKQFRVTPGETLTVDRVPYAEGENFTISDVLLVTTDKGTQIGAPLVSGATVTATVTSHGKGDKIRVATYKSKSRTRKVNGHRQLQSVVTIGDITTK